MQSTEPETYCPVCNHCGYVGCCGVKSFLENHVRGKTDCLHADQIIDEIEEAFEDNRVLLWIDDERPAPEGYIWLKSVNAAICLIAEFGLENIKLIDLDHDAGDYADDGGDFINILDWLEELNSHIKTEFRIHSMNPVGRRNMARIIERNGWKLRNDSI